MRRRKFNKGNWAVMRERLGTAAYEPPPELPEKEMMSDFLPNVLKKAGLKDQGWLQDINRVWPDIAGPMLSGNCIPGRYERGRLTLYVAHPVWLNEIQQHTRDQLLKKLQATFSKQKIRELHVMLNPNGDVL